jgi:hypothetical protein
MSLPVSLLRCCVLAAALGGLTVAALAEPRLAEPPQPGEHQVQLAPRPSPARASAGARPGGPERPVAASYRTMREAAEAGVRPFDAPLASPEVHAAPVPSAAPGSPVWHRGALFVLALLAGAALWAYRRRRPDGLH